MSNTRKAVAAKAPAARKAVAARAPAAPQTGAEILGRINPQRRVETTKVCLRSDLVAEFQAADEELVRLKAQAVPTGKRLNPTGAVEDTAEVRAQARKIRALEEQIVDSQVTFRFEARNKNEWRALIDDYPPRKSNQMDHVVGYDRESVMDELVRVCLVEPTFEDCPDAGCVHETCGTWQQLLAVINPSEWAELRDTANLANSGVVEAPKSALASQVLDRRSSA